VGNLEETGRSNRKGVPHFADFVRNDVGRLLMRELTLSLFVKRSRQAAGATKADLCG
jgi:hypothetical protein